MALVPDSVLVLGFLSLLHGPYNGAEGSEIFISNDLGEGLCEAWNSFQELGNVTQPSRTNPKTAKRCGYYKWTKCEPPCTPVTEVRACEDSLIKPGAGDPIPLKRIVGGKYTKRNEFPQIVYIRIRNKAFCGGAIIHENWVLTAAHCIMGSKNPGDFMVVAGEYNRNEQVNRDRQVQTAIAIKVHENYVPEEEYNDIALLKVRGFKWTHAVRAAVVPFKGSRIPGGFTILGWGRLSEDGPIAGILRKADLITIDSTLECNWKLNAILKRKQSIMLNTSFCGWRINGEKIDACQGDSGSPVLHWTSRGYAVIGITSWGFGCARPNIPSVYTAVAPYDKWIKRNILPDKLPLPYPGPYRGQDMSNEDKMSDEWEDDR